MTASLPSSYHRIVLARRPPGEPAESDFRVETAPMPTPGTNQVPARVVYLSLDPQMRGRMREVTTYARPIGGSPPFLLGSRFTR